MSASSASRMLRLTLSRIKQATLGCSARAASSGAVQVRSFGGSPETDQSFLGKAHNKFVDLKNALVGGDDRAVINEVERGEDFIKAKFEAVLEDRDLPTPVRDLINRAYGAIKADHDEVSRLKHQLN